MGGVEVKDIVKGPDISGILKAMVGKSLGFILRNRWEAVWFSAGE